MVICHFEYHFKRFNDDLVHISTKCFCFLLSEVTIVLFADFSVHEQSGAYCIQYMPRYRSLLAAGKNGCITAFDDRCLVSPVHQFLAHETPIKCLAVDPFERFYVTGSAAGDVKVWNAASHKLCYESTNEHARTSLFKNFGSGTVQVLATTEHILTCGADGSLKMKTLPDLAYWA